METRIVDFGELGDQPSSTARFAFDEPPASFGVYEEGDGLFSVYMTPFSLDCLSRALAKLELGGVLLDATPRWGVLGTRVVTQAEVARLHAPLELIHSPTEDDTIDPITLMAAPHQALPEGSGRRLAVSLHDANHAVVYTRDEKIVAAILTSWLEDRVHTMSGSAFAPPVSEHALESVLVPLPIEAWRRVSLERHSRYWSLDVSALASDLDGTETVVEEQRWVGCPTRAWRAGWSW